MTQICIPVPTREAVAWGLADLLKDAFRVPEPAVFWYTYLTDHPEQVLSILSDYGTKHPENAPSVAVLTDALRAVTEDEQKAVERAAVSLV